MTAGPFPPKAASGASGGSSAGTFPPKAACLLRSARLLAQTQQQTIPAQQDPCLQTRQQAGEGLTGGHNGVGEGGGGSRGIGVGCKAMV